MEPLCPALEPIRKQNLQAWMTLRVQINEDKGSGMFCCVDIVDATEKSMSIVWEYCFACPGYQQTGIHHDCIFNVYRFDNTDSKELIFNIDDPAGGESHTFRGKVGFTRKAGGSEIIRIIFTKIEKNTLDFILSELSDNA